MHSDWTGPDHVTAASQLLRWWTQCSNHLNPKSCDLPRSWNRKFPVRRGSRCPEKDNRIPGRQTAASVTHAPVCPCPALTVDDAAGPPGEPAPSPGLATADGGKCPRPPGLPCGHNCHQTKTQTRTGFLESLVAEVPEAASATIRSVTWEVGATPTTCTGKSWPLPAPGRWLLSPWDILPDESVVAYVG